jgi:hypothetical protein
MTDAHAAMWAWSACSVHGNHLFSDEWRYDVYQKALDRLLRDLTAAPEKPDTFTCPCTRGLQEASGGVEMPAGPVCLIPGSARLKRLELGRYRVAATLRLPRALEEGGTAMETARIEELLERLIDQNAELIDHISELLKAVQDVKAELTATNAEVIQSLFKIEQSLGKA